MFKQLQKSTGINSLSGDINPVNNFYKLIWHSINYFENHLPDKSLDKTLKIEYLKISKHILNSEINNFPDSYILPRALCDIFWKTLPWSQIINEFGELNILDIGCGAGRTYDRFFSKILEKNISSNLRYTGVDISPSKTWRELDLKSHIKLVEKDALSFLKGSKLDFNLIVSQSSLEHISNDLSIHKHLSNCIKNSKQTVVQIHLVPSVACHAMYGRHGYRHYNKRKISKLTKLYSSFSKSILFPLGDHQVNKFHLKWGKGESLETPRFKDPSKYMNLFRKILREHYDNIVSNKDSCKDSTFLAFVIVSNPKSDFNLNLRTKTIL